MNRLPRTLKAAIFSLTVVASLTTWPTHANSLGGDFTLTKHTGETFRLSDIQGHVGVIFFGFTHCPDVCPNTLMDIQRLMVSLKDRAKEVKVLFISVDPQRDTLEKLESYVRYFNENMIGLTGTSADINKVLEQYNATVSFKGDLASNNYQVEHNANLFLIDKHGKIGSIILPRTPFSVLQQQVIKLIDQAG